MRTILVLLMLVISPTGVVAKKARLALAYSSLELPGAPSTILPADLNRDGLQDLVVAVAYTRWDQISIEETTRMDDVEGLVEVLTIVPSLFDQRELWVFLADSGGYRRVGPLALDLSVLSLDYGPPEWPIIALTDDGLSALRLTNDASEDRLELVPVLSQRSVLAGTETFVPDLALTHDLDGDSAPDLLLPTPAGASVYRGLEGRLHDQPSAQLAWPAADERGGRYGLEHHHPLPEIRDVNGDGRADLLLPHHRDRWSRFHLLRNAGDGRFAAPVALPGSTFEESFLQPTDDHREDPDVVYFGDLDGDGLAELILRQDLADPDSGFRKEMRQAKRPPVRYSFFRTGDGQRVATEPYAVLEAAGYAFPYDDEDEIGVSGGFRDLDGDGRLDLIALTLDFSILQAVRILTVKRISIGIDFHVWCQAADGRFRAVEGLDLSGKFRLDLDNLRLGRLSQFAGDFDGDGRADFVQMGRGREVTIHRGRAGCSYPAEPDLLIRLEEEPQDLQLVQVRDFDADGLADLLVIQPQAINSSDTTAPVRLDLYRSGGTR